MIEFIELAKAKIQESRNLVISKLKDTDNFTLAQQIVVEEQGKQTTMFMKGAIHVDGIESLYSLRNAISEAIDQIEKT